MSKRYNQYSNRGLARIFQEARYSGDFPNDHEMLVIHSGKLLCQEKDNVIDYKSIISRNSNSL